MRNSGVFTIESKTGFYVGDICYVLNDDIYYGIWGKNNYEDGSYTDPKTGFSFAVVGTLYGDGLYYDQVGNEYGVDAGVIGIVPLELCTKNDPETCGHVVKPYVGEVEISKDPDGTIYVNTDGDECIVIDTGYDDEYDDYDEYEEGESEEDSDSDMYDWMTE